MRSDFKIKEALSLRLESKSKRYGVYREKRCKKWHDKK